MMGYVFIVAESVILKDKVTRHNDIFNNRDGVHGCSWDI